VGQSALAIVAVVHSVLNAAELVVVGREGEVVVDAGL